MSRLARMVPEDDIMKFINEVKNTRSDEKLFEGIIDPSEALHSLFQIVIQSSAVSFGISFSTDDNKIIFDKNKFKTRNDLVNAKVFYDDLTKKLVESYSESDFKIIGQVLYSSAINYMRKHYPRYHDFLQNCIIESTDKVSSLGVTYDKRINKVIIFYNPVFIGRSVMQNIYGEISALPDTANFDALDATYVYDWMTVMTSVYFFHEILHAMYDEHKRLREERKELAYVDKDAKNIINDFYINNQLKELFSGNKYIRGLYSDLGLPAGKKFSMPGAVADHFSFIARPTSSIAIDISDPDNVGPTFEEIARNLGEIIDRNIVARLSGAYTSNPSSKKDENTRIPFEENIIVYISANTVAKNEGVKSPQDFYAACSEVIKYMFREPPASERGTVGININDDYEFSDDPPEMEDEDTIFFPIPPGTAVRINDTGDEGIVTDVLSHPDGSFTVKVNRGERITSLISEDLSQKIPRGWKITDDVLGEFNIDDITVLTLPPQRTQGSSGQTRENPAGPTEEEPQRRRGTSQDGEESDTTSSKDRGASAGGQQQGGEPDQSGTGSGAGDGDDQGGQEGEEGEGGTSAGRGDPAEREGDKTDTGTGDGGEGEGEEGEGEGEGTGRQNLPGDEDDEEAARRLRRQLSNVAKDLTKELDLDDETLSNVIDPDQSLRDKAAEEALSDWRRLLRDRVTKTLGVRSKTDLDAPSRRIAGVHGEEVIEKTLEDLCICFDISVSMDVETSYGFVLSFLEDLFKTIRARFKRVGLSFWARNSAALPMRRMLPSEIKSAAKSAQSSLKSEIDTMGTVVGNIFEPFGEGGKWRGTAKPSLTLVFTDGGINGPDDIPKSQINWYNQARRGGGTVIWVVVPGGDFDPELNRITKAFTKAGGRIKPKDNKVTARSKS